MNQFVSIAQPFLPLFNRSWTFEAWIYLPNIPNGHDNTILGQLASTTPDNYFHVMVRGQKLRLGFYSDDLESATNLTPSRWYHTAFSFDSVSRNQSIYIDGVLAGSQEAISVYLGSAGALDVGVIRWSSGNEYFDGLIDQLSFINRSKAPSEILRDATLTLYFSFDGNSLHDQGPLKISGSVEGSISFVSGRRGQALRICHVPDSYLTVGGLVLLGRDGQPYSFSIWINPSVRQSSIVIHMSRYSDGTTLWCVPMMGLNNAGQLITRSWAGSGYTVIVMGPSVPLHSWTHVVSTYSVSAGLRLYVNGSLCNCSSPFTFVGSGGPNHIFVGSARAATTSSWWPEIAGQYSGAVDELQVYSRELTANEVNELASA